MFRKITPRITTAVLCALISHGLSAQPFTFIAHGDTAYSALSYAKYEALIDRINAAAPAFTVHIGDTKGHQPCNQASLDRVAGFFERFEHPVFYTPGDNEWTDCSPLRGALAFDSKAASNNVALQTLADIRARFFNQPRSLGQTKRPYTRQSDVSAHKQMVENAYWTYHSVLFVTAHVVGSKNGLKTQDPLRIEEAKARQRANLDWLEKIPEWVKKHNSQALVIMLHAELFDGEPAPRKTAHIANQKIRGGMNGPYFPIVEAIAKIAQSFARPVLLVNGDLHTYTVDNPFTTDNRGANVTHVQVFGEPFMEAVSIRVDLEAKPVFRIAPLSVATQTQVDAHETETE